MGNGLSIATESIDGLILTPLKIVDVSGGDVLHAMKNSDPGFISFGEAYFSTVDPTTIKAWKRHREMTLNLIVPVGEIKFVIFDDRRVEKQCFREIILSKEHYYRLTVPPMVWLGFQGLHIASSMLLNIASMPHDPQESDRKSVDEIEFDWSRT